MNSRSTNNIGGDCKEKTSVRVQHAPGGQSSFQFAYDTPQPNTQNSNKYKNNQQQSSLNLGWDQPTSQKANQGNQAPVQTSVKVTQSAGGTQGYDISQQENSQVPTFQPSIKVRNPPGGRSQITFG